MMLGRRMFAACALAFVVVACGEADPTESDEYVAVQGELDAAKADRDQLQKELDARNSDVSMLEVEREDLTTERDDLTTERDGFEEELATSQESVQQAEQTAEDLEADRDTMQDERDQAVEERDAALAEVDRLREQYDPQIRAKLQSAVDVEISRACEAAKSDVDASIRRLVEYDDAWAPVANRQQLVDAVTECAAEARAKAAEQIRADLQFAVDLEIYRACEAAKSDVDASIRRLVKYDDAWAPVANRQQLVDAVTECAAAERAKTTEQREQERLDRCQPIAVDELERNPAAYEGRCVTVFANIVQFDAATGPCSFQADLSEFDSGDVFDYTTRSNFGLTDDELLSAIETECPNLDGIDVNDFIKVYATGLGAYTYDTNIGGSNTIPSFRIERVELIRKA